MAKEIKMGKLKKVVEKPVEDRDEPLTADGFDAAFIGWFERCAHPPVAVYDYEKCVKILREDMSDEDAREFMDFNVVGAWMGEGTPAFMYRSTKAQFDEHCAERLE